MPKSPEEVLVEMKSLNTAMQTQFKGISDTLDGQKAELKKYGMTTEESRQKIDEYDAKVKSMVGELAEMKTELEKMTEGIKSGKFPIGAGGMGGDEFKSPADQFCEAAEFKDWSKKRGGASEKITLKNLHGPNGKTQYKFINSESEAAIRTVFATYRLQEMFVKPHRQVRMRDIIPVVPTSQGAVWFVRQTSYAQNAATVAEMALKPESNINYEVQSRGVSTIAHYMPVARQLVDDATGLRGWIDQELTLGLKDVEDVQILWGDGLNENLTGIMTDTGIQNYSWSQGQLNDTRMDAIRRAMTRVTTAYFVPTAIVLNPYDWEEIETQKTSFGSYVWVNPQIGGSKQLWRLDVVETTAMSPGDFLVGAFDRGTTLWDREEVGIRIADQHADFFVRNAYVILCEERVCQTVFRPEAFVYGLFDAPPTGSTTSISGQRGSYPPIFGSGYPGEKTSGSPNLEDVVGSSGHGGPVGGASGYLDPFNGGDAN